MAEKKRTGVRKTGAEVFKINAKKCQENSQKFDGYFIKLVEGGMTPCVSLAVQRNNEVIYEIAHGHPTPNKEERAPISKETRFNIASVTKPITGSLVVKLVEMGLLTLSDPVKRYIPEYKFSEVTILHLLTHTAGYAPTAAGAIPAPAKKEEVPDFLKKIYAIDSLRFDPGETYEYFTFGYSILMDIIERLTGKTLEEFARESLFSPAQMNDTTYDFTFLKDGSYVLPYDHRSNSFLKDFATTAPTGDRGIYTTARDLLKFGSVFLNGGMFGRTKVFAKASVDLMLKEVSNGKFMVTPNFMIKGDMDFHGTFGDLNSSSAVGHGGYTGCMLLIDPVYNTTAAMLTNSPKYHEDWHNYKRLWNIVMSM